jgi:23S rRNA pseudouridine1911/1915/1917 synthase
MLAILHEDGHLLVTDKPAGVSTQAPEIAGATLERAVRAYLDPTGSGAAFVGTLHRLDRPVSGVVAWAKTPAAARHVSRQFEARRVRKVYWTLVEGRPGSGTGVWEDWLAREATGLGRVQVCAAGTPRAQPARTRWRVIAEVGAGLTWLELLPETGRMHQLRVQAATRGLPIAGDALYGAATGFRPGAIALHARSLGLRHPADGREVEYVAPAPAGWPE